MGNEPRDDIVIPSLFHIVQTCHNSHFFFHSSSNLKFNGGGRRVILELKIFQEFCPALHEDLGLHCDAFCEPYLNKC